MRNEESRRFNQKIRSQTFDQLPSKNKFLPPTSKLDRSIQNKVFKSGSISQEMTEKISKLQNIYNADNKGSINFLLRDSLKDPADIIDSKQIVSAPISIENLKRSLSLGPKVRRRISLLQRSIDKDEIEEIEYAAPSTFGASPSSVMVKSASRLSEAS